MRKTGYVLDSYALLAYFQGEAAGGKVKDILKQAEKGLGDTLVSLSLINLGEIIYTIERKLGDKTAMEIYGNILRLPVQLAEVTPERVLAAAHIKARYRVSYADAFAAALTQELGATLVTADPEFKQLEAHIRVLWL